MAGDDKVLMGQKVLALSGGVGGAKLAVGLSQVVPPEQLTIVANTGDDFEHLGLYISPDLDSVMYALAGSNDEQRGWGLRDETWNCLERLGSLGGESWFQLGDKDLATHLQRTALLRQGRTLSQATASLCESMGIRCTVLPMTDMPVRTLVHTAEGELSFQSYFVREQCRPKVTGFRFAGAERAAPQAAMLDLLKDPELGMVLICPSNPFVSVDPILSVPGVRQALLECAAPVVAVSPIIGGRALKGPAAKMLAELDFDTSAASVAKHYQGLVDTFVLDRADGTLESKVRALGMKVLTLPTVMHTFEDRIRLARLLLACLGDSHGGLANEAVSDAQDTSS